MTRAIAKHDQRSMGRLLLAGFMAWALFLQAFATESHIHQDGISAAASALTAGGSSHHNAPVKDDSAKCPICQQMWRAGQYIAPSWSPLFLLVRSVSTLEIGTFERPLFTPVSHIWRGRGPPTS